MSFPFNRLDADICPATDVPRLGLVNVDQARLEGLVTGQDEDASLGFRPRTLSWPSP